MNPFVRISLETKKVPQGKLESTCNINFIPPVEVPLKKAGPQFSLPEHTPITKDNWGQGGIFDENDCANLVVIGDEYRVFVNMDAKFLVDKIKQDPERALLWKNLWIIGCLLNWVPHLEADNYEAVKHFLNKTLASYFVTLEVFSAMQGN